MIFLTAFRRYLWRLFGDGRPEVRNDPLADQFWADLHHRTGIDIGPKGRRRLEIIAGLVGLAVIAGGGLFVVILLRDFAPR